MDFLVDSNVLIDVTTENSRWSHWSSEVLIESIQRGVLFVNPIVYAEVSVSYERIEEVDEALFRIQVKRKPIPYQASFLAGKAFRRYRRRGGTRTSPLPDFFIGAHAAVEGLTLVTRDASRYRTYFPKLQIVAPN